MNEKNDTLEDLLFYTRSFAKEYCEENNITCLDDFPETIPMQFVSGEVRRNIFLTVKEGLHNIVKHAAATQVQLIVRSNQELTVIISDNGKGISLVNLNQYSGGNGLKNMQRRIESIGGRFILSNGKGTTIRMEVPLQNL
jgi:signal transduction histidine kinase